MMGVGLVRYRWQEAARPTVEMPQAVGGKVGAVVVVVVVVVASVAARLRSARPP
jgi:hypothetical protein